ncbi:MAG: aminopeptidase N [Boseongicola sp. SB0673_bin_14]|nr:aminopeptidase N [Boseongicola sp. SB0673_bin_14]
MNDSRPQPVRLADYRPPSWLVDSVHLTFLLDPAATRVTSRISFAPNPEASDRNFRLDGEGLRLIRASIDGLPVHPRLDERGLTAVVPERPFTWECEVEINPGANTALDGLFHSDGLFCTQCEAEGFRKITYYPDRPDVIAPFDVRMESDLPVLLSNGNPVAKGSGWAEWRDPWPKPSYLFALVAGDLVAQRGHHRTPDGRSINLNIWVRPGDEHRCTHALDSLKRAMKWDERAYGRVCDLDVFNLVAVDKFNAGAMENKGLNIFNSKYVLASPETATDRDYEAIESIVAHEYFHNWTGNRITCRDWFQLCLKEGLTVFRDQQFSEDLRGRAVKRIDDVMALRSRQFREDNGPLAHPVRPESYIEINNFYTATVYEKGAEVIRMLKTLVGDAAYEEALQTYFERHDGQAATINDFFACFTEVAGNELDGFERWWDQSGTPRVAVSWHWDGDRLKLTLRQRTPPTPGQPTKRPLRIPLAVGVLGQDGKQIADTEILNLKSELGSWISVPGNGWDETDDHLDRPVASMDDAPVLSLNRDFSAPVILERQMSEAERLTILAHDPDLFNRWEAGRLLAKEELARMVTSGSEPRRDYIDALGQLLSNDSLDPAFRAAALDLPSEEDLLRAVRDQGQVPDPMRIHDCRQSMRTVIAEHLHATFVRLFQEMEVPGPYRPDPKDAARRALRLASLSALVRVEGPELAREVCAKANNMTETLGALRTLVRAGEADRELAAFFERWKDDPNVLDKWFSIQILEAGPDAALAAAKELSGHSRFNWKTPNRFRAVIGVFAATLSAFHHPSGAGYELTVDWLARLDPVNPHIAARTATAFETRHLFDEERQHMMAQALKRLLKNPSRDLGEIVSKILEG